MTATLRILVVGGYGTFGGRIIELLENEPRLELLVAGRSLEKARAYCRSRGPVQATLTPAVFDRDGDARAQIAALRPTILVDASGPFQAYGGEAYRLIEACIAERVNYLDLADSSDFVAGIGAFDVQARDAGVHVLTGMSSFPVLTAAAMRRLSAGMQRVDCVTGGIAPSPYAGVGLNVIRAIAGYAGQKITLTRDGRPATGQPFTEQVRFTIAPPGYVPLRSTLFSLVDVPDLRALPLLRPDARTIWMGAGPAPETLHRALIVFAWLVRLGLARSLSPLAPLMQVAINTLRWGEHRGGMFILIEGAGSSGEPVRKSWNLLAEGDDGPLIPSMAVEAVVRRTLRGLKPAAGARAGVRDLELDDYGALFRGRTIFAGIRDHLPPDEAPLYRRLLGPALDALPAPIRAMHEVRGEASARGRASVERGTGLLARLAARLMRFPPAMAATELEVSFRATDGREIWTRDFNGKRFSSAQYAGAGRWDGLLCERFGPLRFGIALVTSEGRLTLVLRRWSAFGVPLPMWLCPRSVAHESAEEGVFRFHVEIGHPVTGLIVRYSGWLARCDEETPVALQSCAVAS